MIELPIKSNILFSKKWEGQILDFEITPVKADTDEDGTEIASACDESEANAFGVYARMQEGTAEWLADWETKEAAEAFIAILRHVGANFYKEDALPKKTHGLTHLASVHGYYDPVSGNTYNYTPLGIDMLNPVSLDEIEIGDWFRSLTDDEWKVITIGKYSNLHGYEKNEIAEFIDGYFGIVPLSEIVNQLDAWGNHSFNEYVTETGNSVYYIEKVA